MYPPQDMNRVAAITPDRRDLGRHHEGLRDGRRLAAAGRNPLRIIGDSGRDGDGICAGSEVYSIPSMCAEGVLPLHGWAPSALLSPVGKFRLFTLDSPNSLRHRGTVRQAR